VDWDRAHGEYNSSGWMRGPAKVGKAASGAVHVRDIPSVVAADDVTGRYDVIVQVGAESVDEWDG
jgi:hypothetical protein